MRSARRFLLPVTPPIGGGRRRSHFPKGAGLPYSLAGLASLDLAKRDADAPADLHAAEFAAQAQLVDLLAACVQ